MTIGFHSKKPGHINPYIGWMAVLCTALIASLPIMLLAAEPGAPIVHSATGTVPHEKAAPRPDASALACTQACIASTSLQDCVMASNGNQTARAKCYDAVKVCILQQCSSGMPAPFTRPEPTGSASGHPPTGAPQPPQLLPADLLKAYAQVIGQLDKVDQALTQEHEIIVKVRAKLAELKVEASATPIDTEAFSKSVRDLQELRQQFQKTIGQIQELPAPRPSDHSATSTPGSGPRK